MAVTPRTRAILMTAAAVIWLAIAVANLVTGEYQRMPTWRIVLQGVLVFFAVAFLWESWKPGGLGRRGSR